MGIRIVQSADPLSEPLVKDLLTRMREGGLLAAGSGKIDVPAAVREIIADVRARGDAAVADATARLHNYRLPAGQLRLPQDAFRSAQASADKAFLGLVRRVIENIRSYQQSIKISPPPVLKRRGRELGVIYTPMDRVAVYVPGGQAVYPSSVLMTAVPAQVAGVRELVMVCPPTPPGGINQMVLARAGELGIEEVYPVAGVAGLAALAIGTESIKRVDKIVGPGSAFIAEAKRQLFGLVGIDSIAGPSEVLIIADQTANPRWVAADMLAQAEHDPGSAVLVTTSAKLAEQVAAAIEKQLPRLKRADALAKAIQQNSAIIVAPDIAQACKVANEFAPEHLQIVTDNDDAVLAMIRNAGAIFLGPQTPVSLGDYYAGPSHVLPTGGAARFFGPLSCNDFLKASSVVRYDAGALAEDSADVIDFATREGLTAHAEAVRIRRQQ